MFVQGDEILDRLQMERRVELPLPDGSGKSLWFTSPEIVVLRKLDWYRMGGMVSDRQWGDLVGVLSAQKDPIDFGDMVTIAEALD